MKIENLIKKHLNESKYRDNANDAIKALKDMSVFKKGDFFAVPDPGVKNVWLVFVYNKKQKYTVDPKAPGWNACIVYLDQEDFEDVDNVYDALYKYGDHEIRKHPNFPK